MSISLNKKTSILSQFWNLSLREAYILRSNYQKLFMILALPVATAVIICIIQEERIFESYENTKSFLFAIVSVGIWIGLFNSIQEVCKERSVLKREYMANLNLFAYIMSKVFVQSVVCFVQAMLFLLINRISLKYPEDGIIFNTSFVEIFVTLFLIMVAADSLGLVVSSAVKSGDIANIIAPIILLLQLVMSGVLFALDGVTEVISYFTISKWGIEGLGSIAKLNNLESNTILNVNDSYKAQTLRDLIEWEAEEAYLATEEHLLKVWTVLIIFTFIATIVSTLLLKRISKDMR